LLLPMAIDADGMHLGVVFAELVERAVGGPRLNRSLRGIIPASGRCQVMVSRPLRAGRRHALGHNPRGGSSLMGSCQKGGGSFGSGAG
jgi:uncharacterized membrane protein YgcG